MLFVTMMVCMGVVCTSLVTSLKQLVFQSLQVLISIGRTSDRCGVDELKDSEEEEDLHDGPLLFSVTATDDLWPGVKGQSNREIAGSPRKLFR